MIRMMFRANAAALGALFLALTLDATAEELFLNAEFKDACETAAKTQRVVMIDFYAVWCGPCRKLEQVTWQDREVRAWLKQHCVSLKIDAEQNAPLARRFDVAAYPTVVLLKPDGTELHRLLGYRSPSQFLAEANGALAGQRSQTAAPGTAGARDGGQPAALRTGRAGLPGSRVVLATGRLARGLVRQTALGVAKLFDR